MASTTSKLLSLELKLITPSIRLHTADPGSASPKSNDSGMLLLLTGVLYDD